MKKNKWKLLLISVLAVSLVLTGCSLGKADDGSVSGNGEEMSAENQNGESSGTGGGSAEEPGEVSKGTARDLTGKKLSILGDSISTFDGYIPTDYNIFYPGSGEISTVEKTWWFQTLQNTGMELNANASSSNTTVTGDSADTTGSAPGCSTKRMIDLTPGDNGPDPDILIVFMGTNDFLKSIPLGSFDAPAAQSEGVTDNFCDAYELMIQKLNAMYPNTEIYFCTILETNAGDMDSDPTAYPCTNKNGNTVGDFNAEIATIASAYGYPVLDMHNCGITYETLGEYTSDGVHPNAAGAALMAEYVTDQLLY